MENSTIKYLYFDAKHSAYQNSYKIHRYKNTAYLSIKANEGQLGYTEKLFPGDDRDQIIVKVLRVLYFEIMDAILLKTLYKIRNKNAKFLFSYTDENSKMQLFNCSCIENFEDIILDSEIEIFPNDCTLPVWFEGELLDENLNFDQMLEIMIQKHNHDGFW